MTHIEALIEILGEAGEHGRSHLCDEVSAEDICSAVSCSKCPFGNMTNLMRTIDALKEPKDIEGDFA